ncbi:MAG: HIT domain-containing protein [Proteobacteria bacterium]|nr:HIT domain-containing protein [Pseudomonadota bacterium]
MLQLRPLFEKDCFFIKDLPLSHLFLKNDARFLWLILVPRRKNIQEIYELTEKDQDLLGTEIRALSPFIKSLHKADKLNIAAIGNIIPTLHIHMVARHKTDALWPNVVWGEPYTLPYSPSEKEILLEKLKAFSEI